MAKDKSSSGCLVVGIILLVLGLLLLVPGTLWLYRLAEVKDAAAEVRYETMEAARGTDRSDGGAVVLNRSYLATTKLPKPGEDITREHFVAFMIAPDTTELTKQAFRRVANEATVTWLLQTENITEKDGAPRGSFYLSWQIRDGTSTTSSTLGIEAEFTEDSREALLGVRRGDLVEVTGDLRFSGDNPVLKNARLASEAE